MLAPAGAPGARLYWSVWAGTVGIGDVARDADLERLTRLDELHGDVEKVGGWLTGRTFTVNASESLSGGEPLSVAIAVIGNVPEPVCVRRPGEDPGMRVDRRTRRVPEPRL